MKAELRDAIKFLKKENLLIPFVISTVLGGRDMPMLLQAPSSMRELFFVCATIGWVQAMLDLSDEDTD